jgi:methylenetetrahydrofolate dehydrogenase (NADP+) / methenyltetrahydrofolate cyclohydrolase
MQALSQLSYTPNQVRYFNTEILVLASQCGLVTVELFMNTTYFSTRRIDGVELAKRVRAEVAQGVAALRAKGITTGLAVILVGDDPASAVYVRNKIRACEECGITSRFVNLASQVSQQELESNIRALNADQGVHGILLQLPLPKGLDANAALTLISPAKDVDGLHQESAGALMTNQAGFKPCTPFGVMRILEDQGIALRGKHAVIVGASNSVGKPQALLLLQAGATVTICNSKTVDVGLHTRQADILVAAVGRAKMITGDMIKPGAVVIDVGINRLADGKLCGDVDFDAAQGRASAITPVPGGVGPMTVAMLMMNTLQAAQRDHI